MRNSSTFKTAIMVLLVATSEIAHGQTEQGPNPYQRNYLTSGVARNYPAGATEDWLDPGASHPFIGFRHSVEASWLMGIRGQFRMFDLEGSNKELPLFTLSHEVLWSVRLQYPVYLAMGPKMLWLLPSKSATLPMRRSAALGPEFGLGLAAEVQWIINKRFLLAFGAERWRGTATMRLHGIEINSTLGIALE